MQFRNSLLHFKSANISKILHNKTQKNVKIKKQEVKFKCQQLIN